MRLVLRVLLVECALSSVMLLAGCARVAAAIWPFATAGFRGRNWRVGLGLLVALPVIVGWPAMFLSSSLVKATHGDWLNLAIPWWIVIGGMGSVLLAAKLNAAGSRADRETGCRCGACVAYGR